MTYAAETWRKLAANDANTALMWARLGEQRLAWEYIFQSHHALAQARKCDKEAANAHP